MCIFNETHFEIKKRQEIWRGLRLPVDEGGERVHDSAINRLTVIADEHYEDFANGLQNEMQEVGYEFNRSHVDNNRKRKEIKLLDKWQDNKVFLEIWNRIKHKTRYSVGINTDDLINKAVSRLRFISVTAPNVHVQTGNIDINEEGVTGYATSTQYAIEVERKPNYAIPNLVSIIQRETELKRSTIIEILKGTNNLHLVFTNPQSHLEQVIHESKRIFDFFDGRWNQV
ncbi:hypothetical protein ACFU6E_26075 [Bacillus cereus]|uniref:hypothetical protein n=1 Tax=Bacillus cereus TaxID=1396 RepID=UPI00366A8DB0